jgi:uncharacterized protein YndB with AHSA1/START domain
VHEIDVSARSSASPEGVWTLLADARTWHRWAPFDESTVEDGEGLGEPRRFRAGRRTTRERVTAFEPPRRLEYELVSGLPIRDYRAEVTLTPDGEETAIRWQSHFRTKLPGTGPLVRHALGRFIERAAEDPARRAESGPAPSTGATSE